MPSVVAIQSDGDLEVVILHEAHSFLAQIIGPDLYTIYGEPNDQTAQFHDATAFKLFQILLVEFAAEGHRSAYISQKHHNLSILKGLRWLSEKYPEEASAVGLGSAVSLFESWCATEVDFSFWSPEINTQITFPLKNEQLVSFSANTTKHSLFRLSDLLGKLDGICKEAGSTYSPQELSAVLSSMVSEVASRIAYNATYILELLGNILMSLNEFIVARHLRNPTNDCRKMAIPEGVTSDIFVSLYGSVLVFKRYSRERISSHTPTTTRYLKMRYQGCRANG